MGRRGKANAAVVGVFQTDTGKAAPFDRVTGALDTSGALAEAAARAECTGALGSICEAFPPGAAPASRVLIVGLGNRSDFGSGSMRAVAGAVGRRLAHVREASLLVALDGPVRGARVTLRHAGQAFGEGLGIVGYSYDFFRGSANKVKTADRNDLTIRAGDDEFASGLRQGLALARSTNFCRFLANTPPNYATPMWMADQAQQLARTASNIAVEVIAGNDLVREGLTGLVNVGKASENPPCLIRIEYTPDGGGNHESSPLVFLGKTMTYDTGGLSIKPSNSMRGMKGDKAGGCAVLGAMHAIAKTVKPDRRVVALLVAAENSISDDAYRPDDVLRFRNGVTVEVTNTDAEGRLVLADGLCWACEVERANAIIDLATLTGGVITALGSTYAGLWCDDANLRTSVQQAADAAGERVWRLPIHQEHKDLLRSDIADIVNSSAVRKAHPIQGAAFLSYFVDKNIPWCHLDIAGVADCESDCGPFVKGMPTGWGVRLLAALAGDM